MNIFIESEWIKLLFLLSDMQSHLAETEKDLFAKVPVEKKKKLFNATWRLSASAFAHIIERHYHKIPRHPGVGKFTVPVADILDLLRRASQQTPFSIPGTLNYYRELDAGIEIGFDRAGVATNIMTVITAPGGCIKTAFPGRIREGIYNLPDRSVISGTGE